VKPAGGVDDDDVLAAADAGVDGIECDRSRIGAGVAANEVRATALCPRRQLIDCSGAKRVRRPDEDRHLIAPEKIGEFPDEGRLAGSVNPHHEDHRRWRRRADDAWIAVPGP